MSWWVSQYDCWSNIQRSSLIGKEMFFKAAHSLQAKFVHTPPQPLPSSFWVWEFSLDLPKSFAESDTMRLAGDMQAVVMAGGKVITWSEWYFVPSSKTSIMKANVIILHYFKIQNIFCLQTKENKQNNFITTGLSNDRPDQWKSKMSPPCWRSSPRLVGTDEQSVLQQEFRN